VEFLPDSGHAVPPRIRRDNEQTTPPEPHTGFQREGDTRRHQGRGNNWLKAELNTDQGSQYDATSSRNMSSIMFFLIASAKTCPISSAMLKSRDIAITPSAPTSRPLQRPSRPRGGERL
jgi:hypothetical protein